MLNSTIVRVLSEDQIRNYQVLQCITSSHIYRISNTIYINLLSYRDEVAQETEAERGRETDGQTDKQTDNDA